jgi:hypothetical protein
MLCCHVSVGVDLPIDVGCCSSAMWHGLVRWTNSRLPCGTIVGLTCQVFAPGWGPLTDVDQWGSATWRSAAEVAQSGAAMWHCNSNRVFLISALFCP